MFHMTTTRDPLQAPHPENDSALSFGDWLQLVNLTVVVLGGILGYFLVERVRAGVEATKVEVEQAKLSLEQTKLSIDISKFLNDIRPTLSDSCLARATSPTQVQVSCEMKNIGAHRAILEKPVPKLRVAGTESFIDSKYFGQKLLSGNALPPGTEGSTTYYIETPQPVDWSRVEVVTRYIAKTDGLILEVAKTTLAGKVDAKLIDVLGQHGYSYTNRVDVSSLRQPTAQP
ncbi:MAG: hypothetical protein CMN89_11575 [Sutterellaceae bacterium]|jgi:hypothetical protein|nr:hypothetical protein [Sutterellaceae bacterium]MBT85094.1 hypothetical protein [Sutterellaceae bacterium]